MARKAADMGGREQGYLWHGRLPIGGMTVIAGSTQVGKSTLGYRIAADTGARTLFITTEEMDDTIWWPKLMAAGVDPEKAWYDEDFVFTKDPGDLDRLEEFIAAHKIGLIVVDPIQNHLGISISHDQAVRAVMKPYIGLMRRRKVALLLEAHVLRDIKKGSDPLLAVPAGLRSWARAVYLFGKDPTLGADPELRVLATARHLEKTPESRRFEFATSDIEVTRASGRGRIVREYGMWIDRGEVAVSAKMLLVTLAPETNERKLDRVAWALIEFLREGKEGRMQPVSAVRKMTNALDPPIGWRTVERAVKELGIESLDDPKDARKKWYVLPDSILATFEEMTEEDDEIVIEEIDLPDVPDTIPEDWDLGEEGAA